MSNHSWKNTKTFNILSAVLMLCMIILQCVPFWHYDGGSSSINGYIWINANNSQLSSFLSTELGGSVDVNDILLVPILLLFIAAAGVILCLIRPKSPAVSILPIACGIVGIIGYIAQPAFRLGSAWILHYILFILMLAAGTPALSADIRISQA